MFCLGISALSGKILSKATIQTHYKRPHKKETLLFYHQPLAHLPSLMALFGGDIPVRGWGSARPGPYKHHDLGRARSKARTSWPAPRGWKWTLRTTRGEGGERAEGKILAAANTSTTQEELQAVGQICGGSACVGHVGECVCVCVCVCARTQKWVGKSCTQVKVLFL